MEPPLGENVKGAVGEGIIEVEKKWGAGDDHPPKVFSSQSFTVQKLPTILVPTVKFPIFGINPTVTKRPVQTTDPNVDDTPVDERPETAPKCFEVLNITDVTAKNPVTDTIFVTNHEQNTPKKTNQETENQNPHTPHKEANERRGGS